MSKSRIVSSTLFSLLIVPLLAIQAFPQAPNSLKAFDEDQIKISKLDWILMNCRVMALEQALRSDLSIPLSATSFTYDRDKQKIKILVHIDSNWLSRQNMNDAKQALGSKAAKLMIFAIGNIVGIGAKVPENTKDWFWIEFFTEDATKVDTKTVAIWENGQIIVK